MRFYGFGNYYLSSLQQGLQSAHVVGDLLTNYPAKSVQNKMAYTWAKKHKTMVLLKGGNSAQLQAIFDKFKNLTRRGMKLPFAKFHEDEQSLGGALTYVGIVVPEKYYVAGAQVRSMKKEDAIQFFKANNFHPWEVELVQELNAYPLAN